MAKKPDIRLIAVDLDGTLLDARKEVCREGADALKRAEQAGVHIVVATARGAESTDRAVAALNLDGPVITSTGALIFETLNGPIWASHTVPETVAKEIAAHADARQWGLSILIDGVTSYSWDRATELEFMRGETSTRVAVKSAVGAIVGAASQIIVRNTSVVPEMRAFCEREFGSHIRTQEFLHADGSLEALAILPRQATKGIALDDVAGRLDVGLENVLAIGDNDSDVSMMEVAGLAVTLENGTDAARAAADHVAPHHDEAGVAWALREFVL